MLDDTSRKLLRILFNTGRAWPVEELARRSGRTIGQVKMALRTLNRDGFIEWTPEKHGELKVLQGWENPPAKARDEAFKWWEHD